MGEHRLPVRVRQLPQAEEEVRVLRPDGLVTRLPDFVDGAAQLFLPGVSGTGQNAPCSDRSSPALSWEDFQRHYTPFSDDWNDRLSDVRWLYLTGKGAPREKGNRHHGPHPGGGRPPRLCRRNGEHRVPGGNGHAQRVPGHGGRQCPRRCARADGGGLDLPDRVQRAQHHPPGGGHQPEAGPGAGVPRRHAAERDDRHGPHGTSPRAGRER